jgi:hypothetical protein
VHQAEEPRERVFSSVLDAIPSTTNLLVVTTVRNHNAVLGHFGFFGGHPLGVVRPRWKQEEAGDGNENGRYALNDEKPLPGVETKCTLHVLENSSSEETRQNVGHSVTRVPDGHAHRVLLLGVPG